MRAGDKRPTLTFVPIDDVKSRQLTVLVPEGFPLEKATTKALAKLLLEAE